MSIFVRLIGPRYGANLHKNTIYEAKPVKMSLHSHVDAMLLIESENCYVWLGPTGNVEEVTPLRLLAECAE